MGQNAALGLLLSMLAIAGTAARSPLLAALPIGLLLYKPTYALPLIGVLVVRKAWRECGIVGLCVVAWYLVGVVACGNGWGWPMAWWLLIKSYAPGDLAFNGPLTVSATITLIRLGVPSTIVILTVVAVTGLGYLAIARSTPVEGVTAATLFGLAWSPHAWAYDVALALPMIAFTITKLRTAYRTYVLFAAYGVAASFFLSRVLGFDLLLLITVGGSSFWILGTLLLWRPSRGDIGRSSAAGSGNVVGNESRICQRTTAAERVGSSPTQLSRRQAEPCRDRYRQSRPSRVCGRGVHGDEELSQ